MLALQAVQVREGEQQRGGPAENRKWENLWFFFVEGLYCVQKVEQLQTYLALLVKDFKNNIVLTIYSQKKC